jgi:radical SAM protein with 4Fe4S-binding SPASM domain
MTAHIHSSFHGRKLDVVGVETTLRCDQACVFCGSRAGGRPSAELSTDELVRLFEQVVRLGATAIELTGGETYLRADWLTLVKAIHDLGAECSLVTAGNGVDEDMARKAFAAGLGRVAVSLDGPPEIHNALRRTPNGFDRARRAMAHFRDAGVPLGCNTQVNARNWRELPRLADVLLGEKLYAWQLQLMIPMGRASEAEGLLVQPSEMLEIVPLIASLIERCAAQGLVVSAADNIGYFGPHEASLRKYTSQLGHTIWCAAGVAMLSVDCAGNVSGCSAFDASEVCAGNVRSQDLETLWNTAPELRIGLSRSHVWGFCATCYYASVCRGGCSATSIVLTGRRGNNPYCYHRASELAREGLRERLIPRDTVHIGRRGHAHYDLVVEPM